MKGSGGSIWLWGPFEFPVTEQKHVHSTLSTTNNAFFVEQLSHLPLISLKRQLLIVDQSNRHSTPFRAANKPLEPAFIKIFIFINLFSGTIYIYIYILVKSSCLAQFYHKLIEYTFYLINNNLTNNYYNKKWKKNLV